MQETIATRGLLFDMDGVLISSIGSVRRCWRQWCRHYGVPGADTFEIPHGTRAIEIIKQVKPDIDPEEGLRLIEDLEIADTEDLRVLDGVPELLSSLPKDRWTVVTSATRRLMIERLRVAGLPAPDRIIAAEDVTNGKPDPEPYRRGAEILGFAPEDCAVVEDAPRVSPPAWLRAAGFWACSELIMRQSLRMPLGSCHPCDRFPPAPEAACSSCRLSRYYRLHECRAGRSRGVSSRVAG